MRYYFDVTRDGRILRDEHGTSFENAAEMQQDALRAAGSMIGETGFFSALPWFMSIRDDNELVVKTLTFVAT